MAGNYAHLMENKHDSQGKVEFTVNEVELFDQTVKEVTLFYIIVGESRFKLFRNNKMELVFLQVTDHWLRQAKVNISGCQDELRVKLIWHPEVNKIAVKAIGDEEYRVAQAVQIDN